MAKPKSYELWTGVLLVSVKIFHPLFANSPRAGATHSLGISLANICIYVIEKEIGIWIGEFISHYLPL